MENAADTGGGLYCDQGSPLLKECAFVRNQAMQAGGIYCESGSPWLVNCSFIENTATLNSGGFYCGTGSARVIGCDFLRNRSDWSGGGLYCGHQSCIRIIGCTFRDNHGHVSGGGAVAYGAPVIMDCVFTNNSTNKIEGLGGGLHVFLNTRATITNSMFIGNTGYCGGGVSVEHSSRIAFMNCTFAHNSASIGGALRLDGNGSVSLCNSILAFSKSGEAVACRNPKMVEISHCDVFGNAGGDWVGPIAGLEGTSGNLCVEPRFVDRHDGDCHLRFTSACRNKGDSAAPGLPDHDLDHNPRIAHGAVDMGADEFHTHLYYTGDAVPGGTVRVKLVGDPSSAPVILWIGSGLLDPPLPIAGYGFWHLQFPLLAELDLGIMPSPDGIREITRTLDPGLAPVSVPLQALIGQTLTDPCLMIVK